MPDIRYLKEKESGQNRAETIRLQFIEARACKLYKLQIRMEMARLNTCSKLPSFLRKKISAKTIIFRY